MVSTNLNKIFDEYEVECNNCQRYWLDQCDATKVDDTKPCNSYIATRKMDIPDKVKVLDDKVKSLGTCVTITMVILAFHLLSHLLEVVMK